MSWGGRDAWWSCHGQETDWESTDWEVFEGSGGLRGRWKTASKYFRAGPSHFQLDETCWFFFGVSRMEHFLRLSLHDMGRLGLLFSVFGCAAEKSDGPELGRGGRPVRRGDQWGDCGTSRENHLNSLGGTREAGKDQLDSLQRR